jgi:NAD(P)-dependent dehydrogenase (short-subunit alcohol dehydrogenase family)
MAADIANVAVFLVSEDSTWVAGEVMRVGGSTI